MRTVHRILAAFFVVIGLFTATTGLTIQSMDLSALFRHAPASDQTMQSIREGIDGPPNFSVIRDRDYAAASLAPDFDFEAALGVATKSGRAALGAAPISFVQLRMANGRPLAEVASGKREYQFDAISGAALGPPASVVLGTMSRPSLRGDIKDLHRMKSFGPAGQAFDVVSGLALCTMIFTGLVMYVRLFMARFRMERRNPFWSAGGWWRTLHRGVAIVAATFLTVQAVTGVILGVSSMGVVISKSLHGGKRPVLTVDLSAPLTDDELHRMLDTTLKAYRAADPTGTVKVLRLRYFAGMPQGVIVTGGDQVRQLVFNAATGRRASLTEPNYPTPGQTFGWQADETFKQIHRGDFIGLSGRGMSVLGGLCLLYLSISGAVMYFDLWSKRRAKGRPSFFWS
jgi:uncharacterized iron-regulated membrane protein